MKLSERLAARGIEEQRGVPEKAPSAVTSPAASAREPSPLDALSTLKARVGVALFERLGSRLNDPSLAEADLLSYARDVLTEIVEAERLPLSNEERQ